MPKKLPKELHVRWEENDRNDEPWLIASARLDGVMEDDGPHDVGVYKLVEVKRAEKIIQTKKAR